MTTPTGPPNSPPRVPPREGVRAPADNGNESPVNELHLIDSISDIDLTTNTIIQFNRFVSAKNSVELHRSKPKPFGAGNRSLPSVFGPEDYEALRDQAESGQSSSGSTAGHPMRSQNTGKSVAWADLHASHGHKILQNFSRTPSKAITEDMPGKGADLPNISPTPLAPAARFQSPENLTQGNIGGNHTPDFLDLNPSPPLEPILTRPSGNPFGPEESSLIVDSKFVAGKRVSQGCSPPKEYPFDTTGFPGSDIMGYPLIPGSGPVLGLGQSPNQLESRSGENLFGLRNPDSTAPSLINPNDGLQLNGTRLDLERTSQAVLLQANDTTDNIYGNMVEYNTISTYHSPTGGAQYTSLPYNYYNNLNSSDPVPVYYQETQSDNQQSSIDYSEDRPTSNDAGSDDEFMDTEKPPELVMLSARDLPTPDAHYVAQNVPPALHPYIAKTCKKDCRTWLWKSARQREARLAEQAAEEAAHGSGIMGLGTRSGGVNGRTDLGPGVGHANDGALADDMKRMDIGQ